MPGFPSTVCNLVRKSLKKKKYTPGGLNRRRGTKERNRTLALINHRGGYPNPFPTVLLGLGKKFG